jgi:hypothetical protein
VAEKYFGRIAPAVITLAGIELLCRIHKRQFDLGKLHPADNSAPAVWNAALVAQ